MSNYLRLKELRRLAILTEKYELADELLEAATALIEAGKVTDDEFQAAAAL